ncbi:MULTISPECIES: hypothetical protein [unclassified Winogradskyella]|jgi:hypothetical protein|uniref:hypothetical protein n=1 Tax=unclassified Winogradskyella TaxID=2615021 RepID=UPI0018DFE59B|nr:MULTISPECIES: hypothetical protein [unclassified Winogradskyella]
MRIFKEEQRFTQTWLILIIIISLIVPITVTVKEADNLSTSEFVLTIGGIILASGLIFLFKLTTRIDEKGIHYKFFPFHLKFKIIEWNKIENAHVRTYDPIGEYGGWGLKGGALWNKSKGRAINVSGDIGIQLELKNGKKLLIGTRKKEQAQDVLLTYNPKHHG